MNDFREKFNFHYNESIKQNEINQKFDNRIKEFEKYIDSLKKSNNEKNNKIISINSTKQFESKLSDLEKKINSLEKNYDYLINLNKMNRDSPSKNSEDRLLELKKCCKESFEKLYFDSSIKLLDLKREGELISDDNINDLKNLLGGSKLLSLKYKAKNKNYSSSNFHKSLENIKKILVLIKTQDSLFGFYTSKNFDMNLSIGKYIKDNKAFLFTLNIGNQKKVHKFPINLRDSSSAIFVDSDIFFALGEGYDLYIPNNFKSNKCTANFPNSYVINDEKIQGFPNVFSKGREEFEVEDLEAYHVETFYSN